MHNSFKEQLTGGHPNSLGNTESVVEQVLEDPDRIEELYNCWHSQDEIVRLRTASAWKRICKQRKSLVVPYIEDLLNDIAAIDQASTQWTLPQLYDMLKDDLAPDQRKRATEIMRANLQDHNDWIVLNMTMETIGKWSEEDEGLRQWFIPILKVHRDDRRKSVSAKASKWLDAL